MQRQLNKRAVVVTNDFYHEILLRETIFSLHFNQLINTRKPDCGSQFNVVLFCSRALEGGYGEDGLTDGDLDPDLQMLHDEHAKQIRDLANKLKEEKKKNNELMKQKDQWQVLQFLH